MRKEQKLIIETLVLEQIKKLNDGKNRSIIKGFLLTIKNTELNNAFGGINLYLTLNPANRLCILNSFYKQLCEFIVSTERKPKNEFLNIRDIHSLTLTSFYQEKLLHLDSDETKNNYDISESKLTKIVESEIRKFLLDYFNSESLIQCNYMISSEIIKKYQFLSETGVDSMRYILFSNKNKEKRSRIFFFNSKKIRPLVIDIVLSSEVITEDTTVKLIYLR